MRPQRLTVKFEGKGHNGDLLQQSGIIIFLISIDLE